MKQMTLMQHFSELRRRVLWVAMIFVICFVVGWYIAPYLQQFLTGPLMAIWPDGELLYTGLSDGLMIQSDGEATHGAIVRLMDEARNAGVKNISVSQI